MRQRSKPSPKPALSQNLSRCRGVVAPVLGVLAVSTLLAAGVGSGVAYVATMVAAPTTLAARAPEQSPALLKPPAAISTIAAPVIAPAKLDTTNASAPAASDPDISAAVPTTAAIAVRPSDAPDTVEVPLPSSFTAALAEQRAEIDRLQAQISALISKAERKPATAPPFGPPPLPAIDVAQRPEPKRPRENLFGPVANLPPAPELTRRPPVLAAQRAQTEAARAQAAALPRIGSQQAPNRPALKSTRPPVEARASAPAGDGVPRSYKFEELEQIKVGDTIPDWGRVSAVSRDSNGGISIRTESGVIRKDPP